MKVLIYFPTNARAIDQLSVMEMLVKMGHQVSLLTFAEKGDLHLLAEKLGVKTFTNPVEKKNPLTFYARHAAFLVKFCREHQIDVIFSHLQDTALACVLAKPFLKAQIYYVRHNTDEGAIISPKKSAIINWATTKFLPKIISPSETVFNYLTRIENVPVSKILSINYGYNFGMYAIDKTGAASEIRKKYECRFLIVSVCRVTGVKRHELMLEAVADLLDRNFDVQWLCIGKGDLLEKYRNEIETKNLAGKIHFLGFQKNVADYLEAADVFLHLSETEASNSAVKEAGLQKLPVIVCDQVGDFGDYVVNGENSFLLDKENPVPQAIKYLEDLYADADKKTRLGENLYKTVTEQFGIENVRPQYEELLKTN